MPFQHALCVRRATRAQLALGKADRTACARRLARVNVSLLSYLFTKLLPPNTRVANCGQTAADSNMVTIDTLWGLTNALSYVSSPTYYDILFSHNAYRQTTGRAINATVITVA